MLHVVLMYLKPTLRTGPRLLLVSIELCVFVKLNHT